MSAFLIHPNLAPLAKLASGSRASRFSATTGIRLSRTKDGYRVEVTDGKRAAVVEGELADHYHNYPKIPAVESAPNSATSAIIPVAELERISKDVPRKALPLLRTVAVCLGDNVTTLGVTDNESATVRQPKNLDGRWPDFDHIFPTDEPVASISVDADLLAGLLKVASAYAAEGSTVRLDLFADKQGQTHTRPLRLVASNAEQRFTGLLCPISKKGGQP